MKTSEMLNKAADEIQRRGWTDAMGESPWGYEDETSPICLEGGIIAAGGFKNDCDPAFKSCPAFKAVSEYLNDWGRANPLFAPLVGAGMRVRPYWYNDAPGRTEEEVIGVLRACAVIEHAKEAATKKVSA